MAQKWDIEKELGRSNPDYVVYKPGEALGNGDSGNQHFLVFDGPDGSMMAIWTQHMHEGSGDHRIVFTRSDDEGETWDPPKRIAGPTEIAPDKQASWGFPMVSKSGRIYVLYNRSLGYGDFDKQLPEGWRDINWIITSGKMEGIYSDDAGKTWSEPQEIAMPKSPLSNPDPDIPETWIVWQKPERISGGKYFVGFTRWISPVVRVPKHNGSVHSADSVTEFMRFENIDDDPESQDIKITHTAWGDQALRVPYYNNPTMSCAQEPSIVKLPDNRLFVIMRTMAGCIWYSVSSDEGMTWSNPQPLLYKDHGKPILEPLACTHIFQLSDGRFALFHHNNNGRVEGLDNPEFANESDEWFSVGLNRRPLFMAIGEFKLDADQPIWFDESKPFADNADEEGHVTADPGECSIGMYGSFTNRKGNDVVWFCDRKTYLVGKKISQ